MKVVYNIEYDVLFRKAEEALGLEMGSIDNMATYYSRLDELLRVSPEFLRVPISEGCFEINPDTRLITKPVSLGDGKNPSEWIIGVKDDHMAEVLFFKIDRYFDGQDLAVCFPREGESEHKGQTYVQWQNGSLGALDPVTYVEIQEETIYFGWILTSGRNGEDSGGPLSRSGDLKFAVRFQYQAKAGGDGQPDLSSDTLFSFNTLPVTCKISENLIQSMGKDHISSLDVENIADQARCPRFSNIFNNVLGPMPNIVKALPDHMNLEDGKVVLEVLAVAPGSGVLTYQWNKDAQPIDGATENTYTVVAEEGKDVTGRYIVLVGNNYEADKVRYAQSECIIPGPIALRFVDERHLISDGLADGKTTLAVEVEVDPREVTYDWDNEIGEITYKWYRGELDDAEFIPSEENLIYEGSNAYTPGNGEAGQYIVLVQHSKNGAMAEVLKPEAPAIMKACAEEPYSVALALDAESNEVVATVVMSNGHYNDLYYKWNFIPSDSAVPNYGGSYELGKNTFTYYGAGLYTCSVMQKIYEGVEGGYSAEKAAAANL